MSARTSWQLARLAECSDPDRHDGIGFTPAFESPEGYEPSPGARFLRHVEEDVLAKDEAHVSGYTYTPAENADPEAVGRYQAALAKLKPSCTRCGKSLTTRELRAAGETASTRVCEDRTECTVRSIWRGRSGLDIAGYCNVSDRDHLAARMDVAPQDVDTMDGAWDDFMAPAPERETSLIGTYARMFAGSPS